MPKMVQTPAADHPLRAHARQSSAGVLARLALWVSNYQRRHKLGRLEALDDRTLEDIGLTRHDVAWARGLPLVVDPVAALNEVAHERRLFRMHQFRRGVRRP